ncbi:ArsR/SmtB family transcription factor [Prosthecomicrobium sp. N25]|uniref:ArsR/SmtB family transcription factor n=1 Tax=Prosthecomicrobium sp. N25 TaxID=3129254 RepID=UPI003077C07F
MLTTTPDDLRLLEDKAEEASRLLKLIANDRRLLILCRLIGEGEMTVTAMAEAVGLGQSALSQHLARMRDERLVTYRREGTTLYYRIADPKVERVIALLKELYCTPLN